MKKALELVHPSFLEDFSLKPLSSNSPSLALLLNQGDGSMGERRRDERVMGNVSSLYHFHGMFKSVICTHSLSDCLDISSA